MQRTDTGPRLSRFERLILYVMALALVGLGAMVEYRSAFLSRRMGDLGVYLRGAWAVRAGADLYDVVDNNQWHYNYPPLLAILMAPLGDPPPGEDRAGYLPYAAAVAVWYALSVLLLFVAMHLLAGAIEHGPTFAHLGPHPPWSRGWWVLRALPVLVCCVPIGHTLMRGQVNLLMLLLLCGLAAGLIRGRRFLAGMCLSGMIAVKVFPAYLLIYPLWRRDGRCLAGCAAGLFLGMVALPAAVFGPARLVPLYEKWAEVLVLPSLGGGTDTSRHLELTAIHATDNMGFQAMLLNTKYLDRATRPREVEPWMRPASWILGAVLTGITLLAARRRRDDVGAVLSVGALAAVMLPMCPVCHLHYMALSALTVAGLIAAAWQRHGEQRVGLWLWVVFAVCAVANVLPNVPGLEVARDLGVATYASLLLWLAAVVRLWRGAPRHDIRERRGVSPPVSPFTYEIAHRRADAAPLPNSGGVR